MSLYVLDTDTITLFRQNHANTVRRVAQHPLSEVAVSVISVEEQLTGWYTEIRKAKQPAELVRAYEQLAISVKFFATFSILPYNEAAIARFEQLRGMKLNVGGYDLRIAAIALEHGATVVTRNVRDFGRVPDLAIEDWTT